MRFRRKSTRIGSASTLEVQVLLHETKLSKAFSVIPSKLPWKLKKTDKLEPTQSIDYHTKYCTITCHDKTANS